MKVFELPVGHYVPITGTCALDIREIRAKRHTAPRAINSTEQRYTPKAERLRRHAAKMRQRPYLENGIRLREAHAKAWQTRRGGGP